MAAGIIPVTSIPGWPSPPAGLHQAVDAALRNAGFSGQAAITPDGYFVPDVTTATDTMSAYAGGATQLAFVKAQRQTALDVLFDANFDLAKFIRGGTVSNITAANVGTFLATITNNYRSLRSQIAAAANVATVNAINIAAGWPSNP